MTNCCFFEIFEGASLITKEEDSHMEEISLQELAFVFLFFSISLDLSEDLTI
jgi:hypothetical protein